MKSMSSRTSSKARCTESALGSAVNHFDAQDGDVGAELRKEFFAIFRRNDQNHLLDVVPSQKAFGRMQPDGFAGQRRIGLLVISILKTLALAGGSQNDGELGHGVLYLTNGLPQELDSVTSSSPFGRDDGFRRGLTVANDKTASSLIGTRDGVETSDVT